MRYSCKSSVEYDLKLHYKLHDQYTRKLKEYSEFEDYLLKRKITSSGKFKYMVKSPGSTKYSYTRQNDMELVHGIRDCTFYKKALSIIEININAMESMLSLYRSTRAERINELLPPSYTLPPSSKLLLDNTQADEWLADHIAIRDALPVFDAEGRTVEAFDGTMVRSRAEALIYEGFFIYGIPVVFEFPYRIGKELLHPDFTILDLYTMRSLIWEHLGNWFHDDPRKRARYREDGIVRIDNFAQIGFLPDNNLVLTFGSTGNDINVQELFRKISTYALPPPSDEQIRLLRH